MNVPVGLYATDGTVQDNIFTAPGYAGTVSITAAYDQWTAQRDVLVVDTPSTMSILAGGSTAASVMAGQSGCPSPPLITIRTWTSLRRM